MTITVLDWSNQQGDPPPRLVRMVNGEPARLYRAYESGKMIMRDARNIDTICLHQTACVFGPSSNVVLRNERAFDVPIHAIAFRDGTVIRPYPMLAYLYHGNGWNERSYGLEIEGAYCGLEDDPTTVARREDLETEPNAHPNTLDESTIAAACAAVQALYSEGKRLGSPLKYVVAHRQSSPTRRADPGQAIWQEVAIKFCMDVLGLVPDPRHTLLSHDGQGRQIPLAWDPRNGVGAY